MSASATKLDVYIEVASAGSAYFSRLSFVFGLVPPSEWIPFGAIEPEGALVPGTISLTAQTLGDGLKHFKQQPTFNPGTSDTTEQANASGCIHANVTQVGNVGGGEDDLMTDSLAANTLDKNGAALMIVGSFTTAGGGTKTIKFHFGSTSLTLVSSTAAANYIAIVFVVRTSSGNQLIFGFALSASGIAAAGQDTPAEDETAAITYKFTGEDSGSTDNQAIQKSMHTLVVN